MALVTYAFAAVAVLAAAHWAGWPLVALCLLGACVDAVVDVARSGLRYMP
jgi:hypothetical protein